MKTAAKKGVTSPVKRRTCSARGKSRERSFQKGGEKWVAFWGTDTETETEGLSLLPHNLISAGQRPFAFQCPIQGQSMVQSGEGLSRQILELQLRLFFFFFSFTVTSRSNPISFPHTKFLAGLLVAQTELNHPNYYPRQSPHHCAKGSDTAFLHCGRSSDLKQLCFAQLTEF